MLAFAWLMGLAVGAVTPAEDGTFVLDGDLSSSFAELDCQDGCAVKIRPGRYVLRSPIRICTTVDVDASGVRIDALDTTGVIFDRGEGCSSEYSTWRGGQLFGKVSSPAVRPLPVGIEIRDALVHVSDTRVQSFVRGVDIKCDLGVSATREQRALGFEVDPDAHCNLWRLSNLSISSNWLDGVFVTGADANAGTAWGINSFVNCKRAYDFVGRPDLVGGKDGGKCANFHDQSFLGNTWIGTHSAFAIDTTSTSTTEKVRYFQYLSLSSNGRSTWVGPYAENGQVVLQAGNGPSLLRGYGHVVIGGLNNIRIKGGGFRLSERGRVNRLQVRSTHRGTTGVLTLGGEGDLGSPFVLGYRWPELESGAELRLLPVRDEGAGWLELESGRGSGQRMLRIWAGPEKGGRRQGDVQSFKAHALPPCSNGGNELIPINEAVASAVGPDGTVSICARQRVSKQSKKQR